MAMCSTRRLLLIVLNLAALMGIVISGCEEEQKLKSDLDSASPLYGNWVVEEVSEFNTGEVVTVNARTLIFYKDGTYLIHVYHNPKAYSRSDLPDNRTYRGPYTYEDDVLSLQLENTSHSGDLSQLPQYLIIDWGGEVGPTYYQRSDL